MGDVIFLTLRRLRAPLITLICVYAIAVGGLAMMPGIDPQGRPWTMDIFHAFYVISYTATTIGFGEIPYPFSDAQRLWVTFSIYLSVVGWAYTIGSVFSLTQDATFREVLYRGWIALRVRKLAEEFYIVCGYGQSGRAMCRAFDRMGLRVVVIESRPERAAGIAVEDYRLPPLVIRGDARTPEVLIDAGVLSPLCQGVLALSSGDSNNQSVAISTAMLRPGLRVVARVFTEVARDNLESFERVEVLNPFETFATNALLALSAPAVLQLEEWLTAAPGSECPEFVRLPRGPWIVCGYGRLGHALGRTFDAAKLPWQAIDPGVSDGSDRHLIGGDDADTALEKAGIRGAAGFVAGTDNDAVNLALANRARKLNPDLFVIVRQNHVADRLLIEAARAQMKFVQAELVVHECLQVLTSPLTNRFLMAMRRAGAEQATNTSAALREVVGELVPELWVFACDATLPGVRRAFSARIEPAFALRDLLSHPDQPEESLPAMALLLVRGAQAIMLPDPGTELEKGDQVLFAGKPGVRRVQQRYADDPTPIEFIRTGVEPPRGALFRWLTLRAILRSRASSGHHQRAGGETSGPQR